MLRTYTLTHKLHMYKYLIINRYMCFFGFVENLYKRILLMENGKWWHIHKWAGSNYSYYYYYSVSTMPFKLDWVFFSSYFSRCFGFETQINGDNRVLCFFFLSLSCCCYSYHSFLSSFGIENHYILGIK